MADRPLRLFVAVPLPPAPLAEVTALVDGVRRGPLGRVPRWVHLPNLHLTVRFLGETPPERVPAVVDGVGRALDGAAAFDAGLAEAGSFPSRGKPRTLWLGIRDGATELAALASALDPALGPLGWPPEARPFRPHLTLARLDAASRADGQAVAEALQRAAAGWSTTFRADRVVLYRSQLGGGPPRHEPLLEVRLRD